MTKRQKTGVGCDSFHPKVLMGLTKNTREIIVGVLGEGGAEWQMTATSLHNDVLLDSKNVTTEGPVALMPTLIRWWEALRASEVAKWQEKYRIDWDATDGRNGGARRQCGRC